MNNDGGGRAYFRDAWLATRGAAAANAYHQAAQHILKMHYIARQPRVNSKLGALLQRTSRIADDQCAGINRWWRVSRAAWDMLRALR